MADALAVTLHGLAARISNGTGDPIDIGALRTLVAGAVRVTATAGNGSAQFDLETSPDGSTGWRPVRKIAALIGIGIVEFHADECERWVRVAWTLGGFTSVTFSVLAQAHVLYAKRADLVALSIQEGALADQDADKLAKALLSGTSDCDDALNTNYPLPLTTWPSSLTQRAADIAAWRALKSVGFQPQGSDEVIRLAFEDATKWLRAVADRKITPAGLSPKPVDASRASSGNPSNPTDIKPRMSDNWGDFG